MIINLNKKIVDFKGAAISFQEEDLTIGKAISFIMNNTKKPGSGYKFGIIAEKAFKEDKMDVDGSDIAIIKESTDKFEHFNNNILRAVLRELELVQIKEEKNDSSEEKPSKKK